MERAALVRVQRVIALPLHGDGERLLESEDDDRFRGDDERLVASEGCASRARTAAKQTSDESALAPAGESSDERAGACAAADEKRGTLAFALLAHYVLGGGNGTTADLLQLNGENAAASETSLIFGGDDRAGDRCSAWEDDVAIWRGEGGGKLAAEGVADVGNAGVEALIDSDVDVCAGGDGESDGLRHGSLASGILSWPTRSVGASGTASILTGSAGAAGAGRCAWTSRCRAGLCAGLGWVLRGGFWVGRSLLATRKGHGERECQRGNKDRS